MIIGFGEHIEIRRFITIERDRPQNGGLGARATHHFVIIDISSQQSTLGTKLGREWVAMGFIMRSLDTCKP